MNRLIITFFNLLRLRSGPQYLPASWPLTLILISAYLIQNLLTGVQLDDDNAAAKSLTAMSLQVIVLLGLLGWRGHLERFTQTLSAFAGVGIVFNLVTWALLSQLNTEQNQPIMALLWFSVFFWSLFVDANIYRHALSLSLSVGVLITVLLLAASYAMIELLFLVPTT